MDVSGEKDMNFFAEKISMVLEALSGVETAEDALQILSAVTVLTLCKGMTSAQDADEAYSTFVRVVSKTMQINEINGFTNWTRGTSH